ncbi:MAG TPA: DEAD/DEAH box helicase family protein [Candidatus Atopostipes pullistercoris]|uniref:DEAD/DEAH box helicase family protein n=1 Tax=Candidatus Atopostipes pullistercoris TaxID=2838467 RepID=A0A9D2G3K2_9LACT|nr:DEAD/DEAH box helicase family protein [Candidatus Atopostipes pullistercoris]
MKEFKARKWQNEAIKRSVNDESGGIFLEAAGGRGKTLCALEIAKQKKAKKVIVVNNRVSILSGWEKSYKEFSYDKSFELVAITDKKLSNIVKEGSKMACDVLIIDEWQNISSKNCVSAYKKVKRGYTIGLSATPIRKKGQNFYPLEKTLWKKANPNRKFDWELTHGKMVYDAFSYSKTKWADFRDYENYISNLPNFMRWEEIEKIENAEENNGFKIKFFKNTLPCANPEAMKMLNTYNVVTKNSKTAMSKLAFGKTAFERILNQTGFEIDFPKLKAVNEDTPLLKEVDRLIEKAPHEMLIVTKSVQIANIIKERNPKIGIWTGATKELLDAPIVVATSQTLGVGVDGLQDKFKTLVVLDPVAEDSGEYDDYRQLLWRVTGSRQKHDVNIIEIRFKEF